jgi:hypothetical protein
MDFALQRHLLYLAQLYRSFLQENRICLGKVLLDCMILNEDQCLALETMSRLDVELNFRHCILTDGAAGAFVECLQSSRGAVKLQNCNIDSLILASALTGDSRVTRLKQHSLLRNDADMAVLRTALANNRSMVDLDLSGRCSISDENWSILCESLKAHPTLTTLNLLSEASDLSDEQKAHRTRAVAEMMKENTVLHTIHFNRGERNHQIYAESILPYLESNLYRPRVLGIKKADIALRRPLLGRALQMESVRNDSNLLWMFLSGNPDAVFSLIE